MVKVSPCNLHAFGFSRTPGGKNNVERLLFTHSLKARLLFRRFYLLLQPIHPQYSFRLCGIGFLGHIKHQFRLNQFGDGMHPLFLQKKIDGAVGASGFCTGKKANYHKGVFVSVHDDGRFCCQRLFQIFRYNVGVIIHLPPCQLFLAAVGAFIVIGYRLFIEIRISAYIFQ